MMKTAKPLLLIALAGQILAFPGFAAVSAEEAKSLGTSLTPWGAEKAGNKEGTIPEWTGQLKVPASYDPKKPGIRPDPFASEKPLFSIGAQNMDKYADKLSEGIKAMMKRYPAFRIDVYPSHRTVAYPQYVINNTLKNAISCKAAGTEGLKLEGCYGSVTFPIPKSGIEAMWNHTTRYTSHSWGGNFSAGVVDAQGNYILQGLNDTYQEQPFNDPKNTGPIPTDSVYWKIRSDSSAPARKAGEKLMIMVFLDAAANPRKAWQYIPGQRRVKLAPDLAYDTPSPQGGGAATMDDNQVFLGGLDRYDWKLIGKKEMFIPYNAFRFGADGTSACNDKTKFTKNHENPDCMRWELHRVWQVDGTIKPKFRHIYPKRTFYWDEDYAGAGIADNYDASGKIYRVVYEVFYPMYESQGLNGDQALIHDVQTGLYAISGDVNQTGGWFVSSPKPSTYYSPEALAGEGIR